MKYKIKLSTVTTYKFGGYCNNFYKISNNDINLFDEAFSNKENFILGKGSNVAFSDKDFEGNVINPVFNEISFIKNLGEVKVGSSVFLPDIARFYNHGIPSVNFGPGDPLLAHTADEHVSKKQLLESYELLMNYLRGVQ